MDGQPLANYQSYTVFGGLNGPLYTVTAGFLQQCGRFTSTIPFEILGYQAFFIGGYDFALAPANAIPPIGGVFIGVDQPAIKLPNSFSNGVSFPNALVALQAQTCYIPSTAFSGAVNRVVGTAQASLMFPQGGYRRRVEAGQPVSTYVRLTGTTSTDDATMVTTLYVNLLPN